MLFRTLAVVLRNGRALGPNAEGAFCSNQLCASLADIKKSRHKKMSKFLTAFGGHGGLLSLKV